MVKNHMSVRVIAFWLFFPPLKTLTLESKLGFDLSFFF